MDGGCGESRIRQSHAEGNPKISIGFLTFARHVSIIFINKDVDEDEYAYKAVFREPGSKWCEPGKSAEAEWTSELCGRKAMSNPIRALPLTGKGINLNLRPYLMK
jgi:hypothetical protein